MLRAFLVESEDLLGFFERHNYLRILERERGYGWEIKSGHIYHRGTEAQEQFLVETGSGNGHEV